MSVLKLEIMSEKDILELGFAKTEEEYYTEFNLGNICISGTTLVEIHQNKEYISVPNCKTIDDLKSLVKLFL